MKEFFFFTAWEMQKPTSYGPFHIIFMICGFTLAFFLAYFLSKNKKINPKKILFISSIFLIVTEIYKQLFYFFVIGNGSYVFWIFPFQLCSLPMYLGVILYFSKSNLVSSSIKNFMCVFSFLGGVASYLEPSGMHHEYVTLTLHSYIWHLVLVFIGLYIFLSCDVCNTKEGYFGSSVIFLISCLIAQFFNTVFHKIEYINMFFISPFYNSSIIVLKDIYKNFGWFAAFISYIIALLLASAIIYKIFGLIKKKTKIS